MTNLLFLIIVGVFVAAAAGYLGSFMVVKRMSLVGDALTHVALPGMAIALTLGISPVLGALIFLTLAIIAVWYLQEHSEVYPEALVGVIFTASLALGVLITPEPDLLEALFGNIERINITEGTIAIVISLLIVVVTRLISKKMILGIISEELAKSGGILISKLNLIYLLLVGVVVALGVKFVGTLLMGALVIVPAVSAKNIARSLKDYYLFSILFGILSAAVGVTVAATFHITPGPAVVLTGISIFIITYLVRNSAKAPC